MWTFAKLVNLNKETKKNRNKETLKRRNQGTKKHWNIET